MKNVITLSLAVVCLALGVAASGCAAPVVVGARGILQSQQQDTPQVWIYLDSQDNQQDGVYRCAETPQEVICRRARLIP